MANTNSSALDILAQAADELGDVFELRSWDPTEPQHADLRNELGGRVTEATPLRLIWSKKLTQSDVSGQQTRFVFRKSAVENGVVRCLTPQQRDYLCDNGQNIQVVGLDEAGRRYDLTLTKRTQGGNNSETFVLIGEWGRMVRANGWENGVEIKIWGFPYRGLDDGFNEILFVITTSV